ncbi:2-succinyl-5-enolpyruvyl-6-hydroxy-3-cyclohexene-1-carboxylic-acid synthase [Pendulispora albinea]|uniref:2-succinyl-5-enolpyruvyl-6-hydroxy-3-cyclohexene-1-carboxylate synthase n=1 Tax=Pendulispora albinea TaxID=2741071 RepID=A0ABZ2LQL7_9BACT
MIRTALTQWARVLMTSFADAGVEHVVISPGSRSTPFVLAAAREPRFICHDIIDERAAAFFALGQARRTGRPSLLLCTSGTAGAHYFPAIVEAAMSRVPLLVLTADRPNELQSCAAAQTIDQLKLFGGYARQFFDLGLPDPAPSALRALRRIVAQATFTSTWPSAGAVHLNARAKQPLEPMEPETRDEHALAHEVGSLLAEPLVSAFAPRMEPDPAAIGILARWALSAARPLIVCGPSPLAPRADELHRDALFDLARTLAAPVFCEAASNVRFVDAAAARGVLLCDAFDTFLRSPSFRANAQADLVLHLGAPPTSASWAAYAGGLRSARRIIFSEEGWNDPQNSAALHLFGSTRASLEALHRAMAPAPAPAREKPPGAWQELLCRANDIAWSIIDEDLARTTTMTEAAAVRAIVGALPIGSHLFLGNSLPIREVDTFCKGSHATARVLSQRGASGIDGLIAGAAGAASVGDSPMTLLLGDISFLHDVSSLLIARPLRASFVIAVLNNGGGRIFEQLPVASWPGIERAELAHLTTPHDRSTEHAAHLYGHPFERVASLPELSDALARAHARPGCTLLEVVVPPHGAHEQHSRIWETASAAVGRLVERFGPF